MFSCIKKLKTNLIYSLILKANVGALSLSLALSPVSASAQTILNLPAPGTMILPSAAFTPVLLKGMTINPSDPMVFDFIIDSGEFGIHPEEVREESERLVKYFLASMTIPEDDLWVNLSPYEEGRIIPEELSKTVLGRDMLAQDYLLKQLTASLMYPEEELGQKFWDQVYKRAQEEFGTSEIPVDTFNKVWIIPEVADVVEHKNTVYIANTYLNVMLDADYEARQTNTSAAETSISKQIVKEIIIPEIEREVNTGKHFAPLRQIYHSLVLAKWYKQTIKNTLLEQVYINQGKTDGIESGDPAVKDKVYAQYMEAYKTGVFNYIKEDYNRLSKKMVPRKYFSGGLRGSIDIEKTSSPIAGNGFEADGYRIKVVNEGVEVQGASSPIITDLARRSPVTQPLVKKYETSYDAMAALVDKFSEETGISVDEIMNEMDIDLYTPIYEAINGIAENYDAGETVPFDANIRVSNLQPEVREDHQLDRPLRVAYLPMKGDPWQDGHLWVILEAAAKFKLDKVVVGIDNSDPVRKPNLSSLSIREPATVAILRSMGVIVEYTTIAKEEKKLFSADGETMLFYLASLNKNQRIDWYYIAGSDHRHWVNAKGAPDTAHKLKNNMDSGLDGFERGANHTISLILSERQGEPVTEEELADLKERAGLKESGKMWQPMNTSSTRVREEGHLWIIPYMAYQIAEAFKMWGLETKIIEDHQIELANGLINLIENSLETKEVERRNHARGFIRKDIHLATGIGLDIMDKYLMKKLQEIEDPVDLQWLEEIRSMAFYRGEEIVSSIASSPVKSETELPLWLQQKPNRFQETATEAFRKIREAKTNLADDIRKIAAQVFGVSPATIANEAKISELSGRSEDSAQFYVEVILSQNVSVPLEMRTDEATIESVVNYVFEQKSASSPVETSEVGGIDFNDIEVNRTGGKIEIQFDPVQVQSLIDQGFSGFSPVIINMSPLPSILPLLGIAPREDEFELT